MTRKKKDKPEGTSGFHVSADDFKLQQSGGSVAARAALVEKIGKQNVSKLEHGQFFLFMYDIIDSGTLAEMPGETAKVFLVLMRHMNWKTGKSTVSNKTIAKEAGVGESKSAISEHMRSLERLGLITRWTTTKFDGVQYRTSRHVITHHQAFVQFRVKEYLESQNDQGPVGQAHGEIEKVPRAGGAGHPTCAAGHPNGAAGPLTKRYGSKSNITKRTSSLTNVRDEDKSSSSSNVLKESESKRPALKRKQRPKRSENVSDADRVAFEKLQCLYYEKNKVWIREKKNHSKFKDKMKPPDVEDRVLLRTAVKLNERWPAVKDFLVKGYGKRIDPRWLDRPELLAANYFNFIVNRHRGSDIPPHAGNFHSDGEMDKFFEEVKGRLPQAGLYEIGRGKPNLLIREDEA